MKIKTKKSLGNMGWAILSIGALLVLWQLATEFTTLGQIMPTAWQAIQAFFKSFVEPIGRNTMWGHIGWSIGRVVPSFVVGSIGGVVLGIFMGWYKGANAVFRPIFEFLRPIPPIAWIPIAIVWFGIGEGSKWFLIFLASFMNVTINAYNGASSVDPELVGCSRMLGANDRQIFNTVVLPSSVPYIFAGLHQALSSSWATVVAAEMIRSSEGVGWIIISAQETGKTINIFVGVIAIGIVGFSLSAIMRVLEDRLLRWNKREN